MLGLSSTEVNPSTADSARSALQALGAASSTAAADTYFLDAEPLPVNLEMRIAGDVEYRPASFVEDCIDGTFLAGLRTHPRPRIQGTSTNSTTTETLDTEVDFDGGRDFAWETVSRGVRARVFGFSWIELKLR